MAPVSLLLTDPFATREGELPRLPFQDSDACRKESIASVAQLIACSGPVPWHSPGLVPVGLRPTFLLDRPCGPHPWLGAMWCDLPRSQATVFGRWASSLMAGALASIGLSIGWVHLIVDSPGFCLGALDLTRYGPLFSTLALFSDRGRAPAALGFLNRGAHTANPRQ